jgi:hypothetical protein
MAMKEYNIEALWKEDAAPESQFSLGYLPGAIKSKLSVFGELKRVRNLFWWGWFFEFISLVAGVFLIIKSPEEITIADVVLSLIYSGIVYYFYISYFIKFIKGINRVPALKIKEAIKSHYDTLCNYISRLYRLIVVLAGISILASVVDLLFISDGDFSRKIFEIIGLVVSVVIYYAVIDGYFDYMYKDSKTEFEILLRQLEDE